MQQWEYLIVRGEYSYRYHKFMPRFINEHELKDWKKIPLFALMNELGNDGWELVGPVGYPMSYRDNELLFKRPKPANPS